MTSFVLLPGPSDAHPEATDRSVALDQLGAAQNHETTAGKPAAWTEDSNRIAGLINVHTDIADRTCRPGHLTGSALVIDPSRPAMLILFHTKLQKWLQPGGHADGDTNLARVALREAEEETGITGLQVVVPAIDVDIHEVDPPKEDAHLHLDVRFLVIAPPGAMPQGNHESEDLRWVTLADLSDYNPDAGLQRMAVEGFKVAEELFGKAGVSNP